MSTSTRLTIDMLSDFTARLNSSARFANINIFQMDKGNPVQEAEDALQGLTPKNGKIGAAVVVEQIELDGEMPNVPVAQLKPRFSFVVMEDPVLNRTAFNESGTGVTAYEMALAVVDLFHHLIIEGGAVMMIFDNVAAIAMEGTGIALRVTFTGRLADHNPQLKVGYPRITATSDVVPATVTITAGNDVWPNGVAAYAPAIYYTLDGSYPRVGNANATLYTVPFDVPAGNALAIRACAYRDGWLPSNVARLVLDLNVEGTDDGNFVGTDGGGLNPLG